LIYAYVISGEIESKVNDAEPRIYKAGESWSEPPNANHPISRKASKTKPAKLLAVFVVDSDDKPLTTPSSRTEDTESGIEDDRIEPIDSTVAKA
jgi:quercetin dioxygenase-like cupin family protein